VEKLFKKSRRFMELFPEDGCRLVVMYDYRFIAHVVWAS
jgi:hypothetical protein